MVFSGAPVSSTNKTDRLDITEIFLKLASLINLERGHCSFKSTIS
jgi:hypothetical protein